MKISVNVTKNDIVDALLDMPFLEAKKVITEYDLRFCDASATESLIIALVKALEPDQEFTKRRLPFIDWSKVK